MEQLKSGFYVAQRLPQTANEAERPLEVVRYYAENDVFHIIGLGNHMYNEFLRRYQLDPTPLVLNPVFPNPLNLQSGWYCVTWRGLKNDAILLYDSEKSAFIHEGDFYGHSYFSYISHEPIPFYAIKFPAKPEQSL